MTLPYSNIAKVLGVEPGPSSGAFGKVTNCPDGAKGTSMEPNWQTTLPAIFRDCVAQAPSRYGIMAPFEREGFVWATDGRIIVRNVRPIGLVLPEPEAVTPPVMSIWGGDFGVGIPCPDVGPEPAPRSCGSCGGRKKHFCAECDASHTCAPCQGVGTVRAPYTPIVVTEGKIALQDRYLRSLQAANATLYPPMGSPSQPWKFTTPEGCEGRLMGVQTVAP